MNVFISQPMNGKTDQEIYDERWKVIKDLVPIFKNQLKPHETIHVLDTVFDDFEPNTPPLIYLAESIRMLSDADILVMVPGWEKARGCIIERECAIRYDIPIYYLKY